MRPASSPHHAALLLGLCLAAPLAGCKGKGGALLARAERNDEAFAHVPVPPADGPKLFALAAGTLVFERPSTGAAKLGELRIGAAVPRSKDAYTKDDCDGGWYAVRPRGFVCKGPSVALEAPAGMRGLPPPPDLTRPMPYRYARARTENVPVYARAPSPADQLANEPDLKRILAHGEGQDPLGASANDVPLDARGVPTGPPVLLPGGDGIDGGKRTVASYFVFGSEAAAPAFVPAGYGAEPGSAGRSPIVNPGESVKAGAMRRGSGVAITGSLELESMGGLRRFVVTAGGYLVPADRLRPSLGSTWHGIDLEKIGLPVAFVHHTSAHLYSFAKGKAVKHEDELEHRAPVPLTGKFRTVEGVRYEETREGEWVRSVDVMTIVKRHKYPDFVKGSQKWIDVSITSQTLTAYEGTKPVYATRISTGRDQLKDPATSASTPRGEFKVLGRSVARAIDPREVSGAFDVADAPWVMELDGFALTGMYWSDSEGEAVTYHDVGLAPIDAHRIWSWAGPELPEGWQAVYDTESAPACWVFVRP